jgi:hypothetical protein
MNNFPYAERISSCTATSCWHYILYKFIRAAKTPQKMHSTTRLARNVGDETNKDTHWWHEYHAKCEATMRNQSPPPPLSFSARQDPILIADK